MDQGLKRQYKSLLALLRLYRSEPETKISKELISICKEEIAEVEKKLAKEWKAWNC